MSNFITLGDIIRYSYSPNPIIGVLDENGNDEKEYTMLKWDTTNFAKPSLTHLQSLRPASELIAAKKIKWQQIKNIRDQKIKMADNGTKTGDQMEAYGKNCYDYAVTLNTNIQALTTILEVESFDIKSDWPT